MILEILNGRFSILKLGTPWMPKRGRWFAAATDEEFSLVCEACEAPDVPSARADAAVPTADGANTGKSGTCARAAGDGAQACADDHFEADGAYAREDGWRGMRVSGTLDFSLIGILSGISGCLADAGVGIFVVSTYNTDYIFVREAALDRACAALSAAGYDLRSEAGA